MSRGAWALIPVKEGARAKSRLAGILTPRQRTDLQQAMLLDLLDELRASQLLSGIALCGPDPATATLAARSGHTFIHQPTGTDGLNAAVAFATRTLSSSGARIVAVLPADLPFLDSAELDIAIAAAALARVCAVVPDRHGTGTNGLVFPASTPPEFRFGPDSFRRHLDRPSDRRLPPRRALRLASLACDIDLPNDLEQLRDAVSGDSAHRARALVRALPRHNRAQGTKEEIVQ
ncbi:2-phospho-L-lactate guanylyltransferase [Nitratireductor sp. CAU 1489]|uniref:3-phospho-D-glycerate guanylyltransferase n=1 Tax=Nitratireductor arenosus TaxID=2682096 RepID=A0A844QCJ1_9HYPH|nr:2-phospho-L-lactate guanylyltransferase [Nitratireductor arenosus]MVA95838.1 2-phospho-L-lactate guanylyltransferase [Nitratireductor arenosus]